MAVEAVTVGDCALDDDLAALLAAAREATVNAVKWSGAPVVSLFAEVEPAEVSLSMKSPAGYKLIRPGQESTAGGQAR